MTQNPQVYLIDGNAYIYRAYHAITPLSNSHGLPTHAIYGFINIIRRVLRERNPEYVAIAFDAKGPNFRHQLYSGYKSNRPPMPEDLAIQIPHIKEVVAAHNILTLEISGLEADDILAAAATLLSQKGAQVTIVTGDKDLLQLVSDNVVVWDPMSDKTMDRDGVVKKYNVPPEHLLDLFSLIGDKSDNVPGVPGIGPKTAEKLINQFGSLDLLYESVESLPKGKMRENLINHQQDALLSRQLIRLKTDFEVPTEIKDYTLPVVNQEKLNELYTLFEFTRLMEQEPAALTPFDYQSFHLVQTEEEIVELEKGLAQSKILALDTETTSLDPLIAEIVGISLSFDKKCSYYLPISHYDEQNQLCEQQLPLARVHKLLAPFLEDSNLPKLGHNLKYDLASLKNNGFTVNGPLWDTMIASYLLDPTKRSHKLDTLCLEKGIKTTSFQEVTEGSKQDDCFRFVAINKAKDYSCEDVAAVLVLWEDFAVQLEENGLRKLFDQVETPLIPVLVKMENAGILVNQNLLNELSKEFGDKLKQLSTEIFQMAGRQFNISSPKQLAELLFEELNLPHGRKTKTGYSTDITVLEKLAAIHDLPKKIIEHRNLSKLKSTYGDKLGTLVNPKTNRIHTSFNQTITATGRLSSSNPNLQNIPIRSAEGQRIREAFVPGENHIFISADYSQIDLRVLAHYSEDKVLLKAFQEGGDIHQKTAAEIFRVHPNFVTGQMRQVAKSINFGIVYGMSAFGLAGQLNISRKEATVFIDRYFDLYKGVRSFMEHIVAQARQDGFITTLMGRRRLLPDITSTNKTRREFAERTALNTPIQGTAADIIKLASIAVDRYLSSHQMSAKVLLQIHDELVLETPENECEATGIMLKNIMENCFSLHVPLVVNVSSGYNLAKV